MKNTIKLFGIIVLVAVIGFSMTGCGGDDALGRPTLVSIAITTPPTKTQYNLGEDLDLTGMEVTATYSDASTQEVTGYSTSGYDKDAEGNQTVTVTYQGKTDTFTVNVIDPSKSTVETPTATDGPSVTLASTTVGAQIWYTTDGTTPAKEGANSTEYTAPFTIIPPVTIKAIAYKDGWNASGILEKAYTNFYTSPTLTLEEDDTQLTYTWTASNPAADSYDVYWKAGSGLSAADVKTGTKITGAVSGGTITDLTSGTAYSVVVTANKTGLTSIDSEVKTATPEIIPDFVTGHLTTLTFNTWADGSLETGGEQWFKFTATAATQYIHFYPVAAPNTVRVELYNDAGTAVAGGITNLTYNVTRNTSRTVTTGNVYYIKVMQWAGTGAYKIGFTDSFVSPPGASTLALEAWTDGSLAQYGEQWFKFTATTTTQFLHYSGGTGSPTVSVQLYSTAGVTVGTAANLSNIAHYTSQTVTTGTEYYVRVWPMNAPDSGTYKLALATSFVPFAAIPLTRDSWADGSFATSNVQWFKFTATAATQYILYSYGTTGGILQVEVQLYDDTGTAVGTYQNMSSTYISMSRTVTPGNVYCIKARPLSDSVGTYRILFSESFNPPGTTALTLGQWADGSLATSIDEQWFKFTATAATQYIHCSPGTMTRVRIALFSDTGTEVTGGTTDLDATTTNVSRTVTSGNEYYIKVTPPNAFSSSGTYKIGFTASTTAPTS
jgi:hypothetical protein